MPDFLEMLLPFTPLFTCCKEHLGGVSSDEVNFTGLQLLNPLEASLCSVLFSESLDTPGKKRKLASNHSHADKVMYVTANIEGN